MNSFLADYFDSSDKNSDIFNAAVNFLKKQSSYNNYDDATKTEKSKAIKEHDKKTKDNKN